MPTDPDTQSLHEAIREVRDSNQRIEECLIGSIENPGGLVARVVVLEKSAKAVEGVPDRLKRVESVAREYRGIRRWVIGALGAGIVAGGGIAKALSGLLAAGSQPPNPHP